jgi:hypothetical protein
VRQLLGADAIASSQTELVIEGVVTLEHHRYHLTLSVRRDGQLVGTPRALDSDSCQSLAGAAAVTLAILARGGAAAAEGDHPTASTGSAAPTVGDHPAISTGAASATPETTPTPKSETEPPRAEGEENEAPRASRGPAESRTIRWKLVVHAPLLAFDVGVLPAPAWGAGVGVGAELGPFELALAGLLWLPVSATNSDPEGDGADFGRRSAELSACYRGSIGRFELGPCLKLTLEDVSAQGTGPLVAPTSSEIAWLSAGAFLGARWAPFPKMAPSMAVSLTPGLAVATSRPTFAVDRGGSVYQLPLLSAGGILGWEWIF